MSGFRVAGGGAASSRTSAKASDCLATTTGSAPSWVHEHWGDILQPALIQHIELTIDRGRDRLRDRLPAGAHRLPLPASSTRRSERARRRPLRAAEPLAVRDPLADHRARRGRRSRSRSSLYTLFVLYRNIVDGLRSVPAEVLESARGMGLTRRQTFVQVELPLADAGDHGRCFGSRRSRRSRSRPSPRSSSTTASASPIFDALDEPDIFQTELVAAARLASGSRSAPTGCSRSCSARSRPGAGSGDGRLALHRRVPVHPRQRVPPPPKAVETVELAFAALGIAIAHRPAARAVARSQASRTLLRARRVERSGARCRASS